MLPKQLKNIKPGITVFIILLFFVVFWHTGVTVFEIPRWILPAPFDVALVFIDSWRTILPHTGQTLIEVFIGLLLAIVTGVTCAAMLDFSSGLRKVLYPLLVISQTFPVIVLAPLLVIWFGFGVLPKIIVVAIFCFFPIAINTTDGFSSVSDEVTDVLYSMNASWWQLWSKVRLPASLPSFFSGMKIAASYSVIAAVVGEWVGGERGLGIYLLRTSASFQTANVFAVVVIISSISLIVFACAFALERACIPWHFRKNSDNSS